MDLQHTCMCGNLDRLKHLITEGLDKNIAIIEACYYGSLKLVKYLVSIGADIISNTSPVFWASYRHKLETVIFLLENGADSKVISKEHRDYFQSLRFFKRWRQFVFRRFFRKTVIPLYYSPGFPGAIRVKRELTDMVRP